MTRASAPGKLFIAGEWAVLEAGCPAIIAAVNRRVSCGIAPSDHFSATLGDFAIENAKGTLEDSFKWKNITHEEAEKLRFAKAAIEACSSYIGGLEPFSIRTFSDRLGAGEGKYGFGSSSAATVAIISAILALHGKKINTQKGLETVFKLSCISHYLAQGKAGSAADIAAAVYGGVIVYKRFNPLWLEHKLSAGTPVKKIADSGWPSLEIEPLKIPPNLRLLAGWSGKSSDTPSLIKKMESFKSGKEMEYREIVEKISAIVKEAIEAWYSEKWHDVIERLNENQALLEELSEKSGAGIVTPELNRLAEVAQKQHAAGKLSGAGGGDCAIALCFGGGTARKVREGWEKAGFEVPDVGVDGRGVIIEK